MAGISILSTVILLAIGALSGFLYVKVFKKKVLGGIWGGIVIGIFGSVLGGLFLDKLINDRTLDYLNVLFTNKINVNFVAAFLGAFLLVWIFFKISSRSDYES